MSIKAIDTQIMVTRAAELTKDASTEMHRAELRSEYQAVQSRLQQEKERATVKETEELEKTSLLIAEGEGRREITKRSSPKKRKAAPKKPEKEREPELQVGPGEEHTIDIVI